MSESPPSFIDLETRGGAWTAREIGQQPQVWAETATMIAALDGAARAFLDPLLLKKDLRILLTGAGSSAYIGQCLLPDLSRVLQRRVEAIPTTDLVTGPSSYFQASVPTLVVSFARSGGSPESLAAVELADRCVTDCYHLVITCNADGLLRQRLDGRPRSFVAVLPEATHDRGFAMTSSFSSMLYAALLLLTPGVLGSGSATRIAAAASALIKRETALIEALAARRFQRTVYLGSLGLGGLANEAALKLLELTDGGVAALSNTPLGFRHGPKTFVNGETLVVVFMSNDRLTRRYDLDLVREIKADGIAARVLVLSAKGDDVATLDPIIVQGMETASDAHLQFAYVVWAQLYAFHASLVRGCRPDTPSASGAVNRVVRGVTIYEPEA